AGSGYYDSAFIFVDPTDANPEAVPVQVTVKEAPRKKLVFGVGFTTDGGPHVSAEYTDQRVPGIGWRAVTKMQLETKAPFIQSAWTDIPDENGWSSGVLARYDRLDDGELVTTAQKLRIGKTKNTDQYDRSFYVQYDRASVRGSGTNTVSEADVGDGSALSANYVWTGRYFDSLPYPTTGYGLGAEIGGGYTLSAPRKPFLRAVGRWLGILPITERQGRIQFRAEGGAVEASTEARIPSTQQFRTGGDTTVRGYAFRDIGIDRANGVVGPGRYVAIGSVEWQRPYYSDGLPTAIENTFFVDFGDVANKPINLRPQYGVGTGVRVRTPIGPLTAAVAYGLDSRKFRLHLTVGFTF
ncbi:MAG: BamA/TamA family outer membrane protein, partial [Burkholderiales bacterium]